MQQWRPEIPAMTFDEVSMERSKSFVKALQELKNLRPQLYSAAEYCEKSYLHNEQKQMVLDNLKDYAVRALVNAVDHLGTVAYKLTDLFEQQTLDVSAVELKISCLNQQILTCQNYTDNEGLRQQQLLKSSPRHHKHYILPYSPSKKLHGNPRLQTDANQNPIQAKPLPHSTGTPASKTLSWHLASEANTTSNGAPNTHLSNGGSKASKTTSELFHLFDGEGAILSLPSSTQIQSATGAPTSDVLHTFGARNPVEVSKTMSAFRSFDNRPQREICRPAVRSKSMLATFFAKNKYAKQKKAIAL